MNAPRQAFIALSKWFAKGAVQICESLWQRMVGCLLKAVP